MLMWVVFPLAKPHVHKTKPRSKKKEAFKLKLKQLIAVFPARKMKPLSGWHCMPTCAHLLAVTLPRAIANVGTVPFGGLFSRLLHL